METINDRFRLLRISFCLSQEEFAARARRTRSEIKNIEYGKTSPKEEVIASVCHTYGINEDWLRHGLGPMRCEKQNQDLAELINSVLDFTSNLKSELRTLESLLKELSESISE